MSAAIIQWPAPAKRSIFQQFEPTNRGPSARLHLKIPSWEIPLSETPVVNGRMVCRSQAVGISSFAGRISGMLAPFTSLMVRILLCSNFAVRLHYAAGCPIGCTIE